MQLITKTVPGLEDLLVNELAGIGKSAEAKVINRGVCIASISDDKITALIDQSRFLTSASMIVGQGVIDENLESLQAIAREIEWEKYIPMNSTIAVRTERVGQHRFTSIDASRGVGEVVLNKLKSKGFEAKVHLNAPNYVITVDIINYNAYIGIRLAGEESLHRKWYRVYEHIASLKPTIANALLELGDLRDKETLLDPVCGGGTIPIEATLYHEDIVAVCNDVSKKAIDGARRNAVAAGVEKRIIFKNIDVKELSNRLSPKSIDLIAADPPFGIRMGSLVDSQVVVKNILGLAKQVLSEEGRLSIIYPFRDFIEAESENIGLEIRHSRKILHGDLESWIIVLAL